MNHSVENVTIPNHSSNDTMMDPYDIWYICSEASNGYLILDVFMVLQFIVKIPSNSWVVWLVLKGGRNCFRSDHFVFCLAFAELLSSPWAPSYVYNDRILKSVQLFKGTFFFLGFFVTTQPLFQCCICVERYLAVVHPIAFLKYKALRYKLPCSTTVWVISLLLSFYSLKSAPYYSLVVIFVPILAIESFCSLSILQALKQSRPGDGDREEMNLMKKKAFNTVLVFQIIMLVNYLPVVVMTPLPNITPKITYVCVLNPIFLSFIIIGNIVHPLLYISRVKKLPCSKYF